MTAVEKPEGASAPRAPLAESAASVGPGSPSVKRKIEKSGVILLAAGFVPLLLGFFVNLWSRPHYRFFPLALAGAAYLAWTRRQEFRRAPTPRSPRAAGGVLGLSAVLLAGATVFWSPWLGAAAALLALGAVIWLWGGGAGLRPLLPALVVLLTLVPPPFHWDEVVLAKADSVLLTGCSRFLFELEIPHAVAGGAVEIPYQRLSLWDVCSPLDAAVATLAFCLFYLLWRRRPVWHLLLGVVSTPAFFVLAGSLAMILGFYVSYRYRVNAFAGIRGVLLELAAFVGAAGLIASLDQFLMCLSEPAFPGYLVPAPDAEIAPRDAGAARLTWPPRWVRWAGLGFALLGLAQLPSGWMAYRRLAATGPVSLAIREGSKLALPPQLGVWQREDLPPASEEKLVTAGASSQLWHYRSGALTAAIALEQPLPGFADPVPAYRARGWKLEPAAPSTAPPGAGALGKVRMVDAATGGAVLWFGIMDEAGQWLAKPGLRQVVLGRLQQTAAQRVTCRIQVLITGAQPLSAPETAQGESLFEEARQLLRQQCLGPAPARP